MAPSLLDRLGLGAARAVANARDEALRPQREERLVAALVAALACRTAPREAGVDVVGEPPTRSEVRAA